MVEILVGRIGIAAPNLAQADRTAGGPHRVGCGLRAFVTALIGPPPPSNSLKRPRKDSATFPLRSADSPRA
jgi:hypothetical protein